MTSVDRDETPEARLAWQDGYIKGLGFALVSQDWREIRREAKDADSVLRDLLADYERATRG